MTYPLATKCEGCDHTRNWHSDVDGHCRVIKCRCPMFEKEEVKLRDRPNPDRDYIVNGGEPVEEIANPDRVRFETKDSGVRAEFESGMVRDTQEGKARFELLLPLGVPYEAQFLVRVAELLARGAEKYDSRNWEKASGPEELERFKSSALRHLMQWAAGETDEDHAAAVCFNLLGYETTKYKIEKEA